MINIFQMKNVSPKIEEAIGKVMKAEADRIREKNGTSRQSKLPPTMSDKSKAKMLANRSPKSNKGRPKGVR